MATKEPHKAAKSDEFIKDQAMQGFETIFRFKFLVSKSMLHNIIKILKILIPGFQNLS